MTTTVEQYESTTAEAVEALHHLVEPVRALMAEWPDERIEAVGYALGRDGRNLGCHQAACAVTANLDALRATVNAIYYLLSDDDMRKKDPFAF